ncbi:restriction endonuclease subunit S [Streptomyces sp. NPDC001665]
MPKFVGWRSGTLDDVLDHVDVRNTDNAVALVLSVTEGRGVIPQHEVFNKRVATEDTSKYKVLQPLDIAWNPYLLWTGAIGQWLGNENGVTSPVYPVFRVREGQDARFWGVVLESGIFTPYFDSRAIGSIARRRRTTIPVFKEAPTFIPPLPVQEQIVEIIGAVDDQIAALGAESDALGRVHHATRERLLGDAPLIPLPELCDMTSRLVDPRLNEYADLIHVGVEAIIKGTGEIVGARTAQEDGLISGKYLFGKGDVIYSKIRPALRKVAVPEFSGLCSADAYPLTPKAGVTATLLREALLQERVVEAAVSMAGRTKMPKVNRKQLFSIQVAMPRPENRASVDAALSTLRQQRKSLLAEAARLRGVRVSLLSGLLDRTINID